MLAGLLQTPAARAVQWALIHFLWEGAALAALLAAALFLFRPLSARLRYGLACAALVAAVLAFGVTLAVLWPGVHSDPGVVIRNAVPQFAYRSAAPAANPRPGAPADSLPWIVPVWIAGVLVFYGRTAGFWLAARRLRRKGVILAPAEWQDRLRALAARLRLTRPVVLLESSLAGTPAVVGYLRPAVLVPAGLLLGLPPDQLEALLLHELAHIRRHDYAVNVLQSLVEGLLFYHPAVWWISAMVRDERESCCDDAVVAAVGNPRGYAAALAALEEMRSAPYPALAARGGNLMRRIRRLLEPEGPRYSIAGPVIGAALLLTSIAVGLLAWQPPAAAAPPGPTETATDAPQSTADDLRAVKQALAQLQAELDQSRADRQARLSADATLETLLPQLAQLDGGMARAQQTLALLEATLKEKNQRLVDLDARIAQIEATLAAARQEYDSNHPAVRALQSEIEALKKKRADVQGQGSSQVDAESEQIRTQIAAAAVNIQAIAQQRHALESRIASLKQKAETQRPADQRYQELLRATEAAKLNLAERERTLLAQSRAAAQESRLMEELQKPYAKWLEEDVVYIITPQERAEYQALQTDAQREQFIEQFWGKRDPTPGTLENEFKEEHYRRIAFANGHFAEAVPGWKTHRGMYYVKFGPPDQIDDHRSSRPAFQAWTYNYLQPAPGVQGSPATVVFTDVDGTGQFTLPRHNAANVFIMGTPPRPPRVEILNQTAQVTFNVPPFGGPTVVYARVSGKAGETVASSQEEATPPYYTKSFSLNPGVYHIQIFVQRPGESAIALFPRGEQFEIR